MATTDDFFKDMAKRAKAKNEEESKNRSGGGQGFDPVLWTAWEEAGTSKIVRFRHNLIAQKPEDFEISDGNGNKIFDEFSPRIVNLATIYGDDHKRFNAYVPNKSDDPGHFYWRMYDLILKKEWVPNPEDSTKKVSKLVNRGSHPELVDRFETNGFNHNISKNKYDRGWRTQKVILANVLDRSRMKDHKEHKHTFLLSKNVNFFEGNEYYDTGVPSYGFIEQILDIVSIYGGLTSYDLLIERTGEKSTPWKIRNASRYIEEVPEKLRDFVKDSESLTEEELSWEMYDLDKMYKPTSYRKWFSKIKVLAKQIDLAFNTHFHEELEEKANKEKEEYEKWKKENEPAVATTGAEVASTSEKEESTPVAEEPPKRTREKTEVEELKRRRETKTEQLISWETLESFGYKGKEFFTEEVKNLIEKITPDGDVVWKEGTGVLAQCFEDCHYKGDSSRSFESPENPAVKGCLWCSSSY